MRTVYFGGIEITRLDKLFKLTENQTTVKTEILAGFTSFTTAAYILAVHPAILAAAGMDRGAVFTATALAAFIGTLLMALLANYPLVLAPGMGLNAYFAYSVVQNMGYSWQMALAAVFTEGLIFILLSLTGVREAIFNAFPSGLKTAVSAGIGLFITFIGFQNAHLVIGGSGSTLVQLFSLKGYNTYYGVTATFQDAGISVVLTLVGIIITGTLVIKNIRGNILLGYCPHLAFRHPLPVYRALHSQQRLRLFQSAAEFFAGTHHPQHPACFLTAGFLPIFFAGISDDHFCFFYLLTFLTP